MIEEQQYKNLKFALDTILASPSYFSSLHSCHSNIFCNIFLEMSYSPSYKKKLFLPSPLKYY